MNETHITLPLLRRLDWTKSADSYEFGRPFPASLVKELFSISWQNSALKKQPASVYEAGVGTGRILVPLTSKWPRSSFLGVDTNQRMLSQLKTTIKSRKHLNLSLLNANAVNFKTSSPHDLAITSSVLHVIPNWRMVLENIFASLSINGILALVGEEADLYNLALNRAPEILAGQEPSSLLVDYWGRYHELRKESGCPNVECSQVGARWEATNDEAAKFCISCGYFEFTLKQVQWNLEWSLNEMIQIVERQCYSSIFTLDGEQQRFLVLKLNESFNHLRNESVTTNHVAIGRFLTKEY